MKRSWLLNVSTTDLDLPATSICHYKLVDDKTIFELNDLTGELFIITRVDYETNPYYDLKVKATDGKYSIEVPVKIQITDLNDNYPIFDPPMYTKLIPENYAIGKSILQINATDLDFGKLTYSIESKTIELPFAINATTGIIVPTKSLDRESTAEYIFSVKSADSGIPILSSNTTVKISLADINDNRPMFQNKSVTVYLPENNKENVEIIRMKATDLDQQNTINSKISYFFGNKYFNLDSKSGSVTAKRSFDREIKDEYELRLFSQDWGKPPLKSGDFIVNVIIVDENDNRPTFDHSHYYFDITEHSASGMVLKQVNAEDKDINENGLVTYLMEDTMGLLDIDNETGLFNLRKELPGGVPNLKKFTEEKLCQSPYLIKLQGLDLALEEALTQSFFCEFCQMFQNCFFMEHL